MIAMSRPPIGSARRVGFATLLLLALPGCFLQPTRPVAPAPWFEGVHYSAPNNAFLVGDAGRVWRFNGRTWIALPRHRDGFYSGIWSTDSRNAYAAGNTNGQGYIDHFDGQVWHTVQESPSQGTRTIWGSGANDVYVTSWTDDGLRHFDGTSWKLVAQGLLGGTNAVWGSSAHDVFACGRDGIVHFDGQTWGRQTVPAELVANAIWGTSPTDVFAVGGAGAIAHYDGTQWSLQRAPDDGPYRFNLFAVWGSSPNDVYAVGQDGWLLHYDGTQWATESKPTPHTLYAVGGTGSDDVTIAGAEGSLLHFDGRRWTAVLLR